MAKTKAELMAEKMAEKRIAQEAFEAGKTENVTPETTEPIQKPADLAQEPQKEVKPTANTPKQKKPVQAVSEPSVDMLDMIVGKKKKKPKKITFSTYGDEELVKILDEDAAERGVSRSYLVNQILNEIYKSKR